MQVHLKHLLKLSTIQREETFHLEMEVLVSHTASDGSSGNISILNNPSLKHEKLFLIPHLHGNKNASQVGVKHPRHTPYGSKLQESR